MSNLQTVQEMYEAFGRGDVPTILSRLAETVEWEYGATSLEVPWLQARRGRAGAAAFFSSLAALDFKKFTPNTRSHVLVSTTPRISSNNPCSGIAPLLWLPIRFFLSPRVRSYLHAGAA